MSMSTLVRTRAVRSVGWWMVQAAVLYLLINTVTAATAPVSFAKGLGFHVDAGPTGLGDGQGRVRHQGPTVVPQGSAPRVVVAVGLVGVVGMTKVIRRVRVSSSAMAANACERVVCNIPRTRPKMCS